jgi:hypothetical protein
LFEAALLVIWMSREERSARWAAILIMVAAGAAVVTTVYSAFSAVANVALNRRTSDGFRAAVPWMLLAGTFWGWASVHGPRDWVCGVFILLGLSGLGGPLLRGLIEVFVRLPEESGWSTGLVQARLLIGLVFLFWGSNCLEGFGDSFIVLPPPDPRHILPTPALLVVPTLIALPVLAGRCGVRRGLTGLLSRHPGRRATAFLLWSALLPLGGLALPWWRRWRRRSLTGCG